MGSQILQLYLLEGGYWILKIMALKLSVFVILAFICLSSEAYSYGLTRYGGLGFPRSISYVYNSRNWPGFSAPGLESTCWGCRVKRSANADAEAEPGYPLGYGYGYGLAGLGYGYTGGLYGAGYHGYGAFSYTHRSPQGLKASRAFFL